MIEFGNTSGGRGGVPQPPVLQGGEWKPLVVGDFV